MSSIDHFTPEMVSSVSDVLTDYRQNLLKIGNAIRYRLKKMQLKGQRRRRELPKPARDTLLEVAASGRALPFGLIGNTLKGTGRMKCACPKEPNMPKSFSPGQWALITGASSGFGRDFAVLLAEQRVNLILTARRREPMDADAENLIERYGIQVHVLPADLSRSEAREDLLRSITALDIHVDILINNAGFGVFGSYVDTEWSRLDQMLQLDVVALSHLSSLVLPGMRVRSEGYILQVASVGAYQPTPGYAAYSAAKAYVLLMGEALNRELRGTGVNVTVLSPGVTATEFLKVSGQKPTLYQRLFMMKSRPVARLGLQAVLRGKMSVVPGIFNNLMVQLVRLTPRVLQANIAGLLMGHRKP